MASMPHLNPDPDQVAEFRKAYTGKPPGYAHGYLVRMVIGIAERHGETCPGCQTCDDLVQALSASVAFQINELPPDAYGKA